MFVDNDTRKQIDCDHRETVLRSNVQCFEDSRRREVAMLSKRQDQCQLSDQKARM
jgi:hypothetical protein